jgi:hypothetical protein
MDLILPGLRFVHARRREKAALQKFAGADLRSAPAVVAGAEI